MKSLEQLGISPAPWYIEKETGVLCAQSEYYKHPIVDDCGNFDNKNDKRLIAAAPELYKCLCEAMRVVGIECRGCERDDCQMKLSFADRTIYNCERLCEWRAALEKAGGKE